MLRRGAQLSGIWTEVAVGHRGSLTPANAVSSATRVYRSPLDLSGDTMLVTPRASLRAGLSALALTVILGAAIPTSATSQRHLSLKQWATNYGIRFDALMTDVRNLSFLGSISLSPRAVLNQLRQDASFLLRAPSPKGDAPAWRTMLTDYATVGKTGYSVITSGNQGRIKHLDGLARAGSTATGVFANVFFNAGLSLGLFLTGNEIVHYVQTAPPTTTTTAPAPIQTTAPATTTTTAPPGIVMTITGTGPANDVTILDGSLVSQHKGLSLPYRITLTDDPVLAGISAQTGSGDVFATISCEVQEPGTAPVTNTSTGPYAVVDCTGSPSF
jgi:hypothetical protein